MHPKLKPFIYLLAIFFVTFVAIQPYNWFCKYSGKCSQVFLSELIPAREGHIKFNLKVEIRNYRRDIKFELIGQEPEISVTGKIVTVKYKVKNISSKFTKFRPKLFATVLVAGHKETKDAVEFIKAYECLCFKEHKVNKGGEIEVVAKFAIKSEINNVLEDYKTSDRSTITVGYIIR